ncbi:MAG: carbon-nitrogen hydrolase family protein [Gemmatimonadaceae bacterium]
MTILTAAVVQAFVPHTIAKGLTTAAARTAEAAAQGATLVVFPETWLPGYPIWLDVCRDIALWDHAPTKAVYRELAEQSVAVPSAATNALSKIARNNNVTLIIGISERVDEGVGRGTLYNSILTFGPDGTLLNHHRKLMPTYTERMVWGAGDADGLHAVTANNARVGALVCWEHWMPLARQALHESGEDIHAALWPTVHEMHQVASRQYAFEGRCFVLAAGSLMRAADLPPDLEPHSTTKEFVIRGGSAIIGPDGTYLAGPLFEEEAVLITTLDLARVREESMTLDVTGHYSRPELLSLHITRTGRTTSWTTPSATTP